MSEKKRPEKIKMATELEKVTTEILAVRGRVLEPFIKVFNYSGENITASALGTLVGVFEVSERSEDSAYIVNFLASVAKKEYFSNPRRGAIESFEASLHKINLALAELVKHGNIAWLGKLHGVLGILEKNNIHFSATGKAEILLLRNGQLSEISAGLASEESSIHPIKTFIEVSSGRLLANDKVILTSPELFTLLSHEDLQKNALRMNDSERFAQFLRTALTNELELAGTIIIDIALGKPIATPKKKDESIKEALSNVFSQQTFAPNIRVSQGHPETPENIPSQTPLPSEYIDSKTGHIYVQGDTIEKFQSRQSVEQAGLIWQDISHTMSAFLGSQGKLLRKGKKQSFIFFNIFRERSLIVIRKTGRLVSRQLRKGSREAYALIRSLRLPKIPTVRKKVSRLSPKPETDPRLLTSPIPTYQKTREEILTSADVENNPDIPPFLREKIATFSQKNSAPQIPFAPRSPLPKTVPSTEQLRDASLRLRALQPIVRKGWRCSVSLLKTTGSILYGLFRGTSLLWKNLRQQQKKAVLIGGSLIVILGIGVFSLTRPKEAAPTVSLGDTPEEQPAAPSFPLDSEKNATVLDEPTVAAQEADAVTSVLLRDTPYLITQSGVFSVSDTIHSTLPAGSGTPVFATPMNDLGFIFLYTTTKELFAWNPINRAFVKNTLILPPGAVVKGMGTYLTYLYVLDGTTSQIYRYPRAEGGFGEPVAWLKDSVTLGEEPLLALSETIFLSTTRDTVQAFFRGRFAKNLESPATPLAVTAIFTERNLTNVYALDSTNKRILVWNQDGALLKQYFSESLVETQSITVNEKTNTAFVTTSNSLLSFPLKP